MLKACRVVRIYMLCARYGASTKVAVRQVRLWLAVVGRENQLWLVDGGTQVEWAEDAPSENSCF